MRHSLLTCLLTLAGTTAACSGSSASERPAPAHSVQSSPVTSAVLGSADFFPGHDDRGFGTVQPRRIYNGGDGLGLLVHITWTHWGEPTAYGVGQGSALSTNGGYFRKPVRVKLRAEGLRACDGRIGYGWLYATRQKRPGSNDWYPIGRWWGKQNLCEKGGGSKSP